MKITSAFADGEAVPVRFTCDGDDVSPPLAWTEVPAGTRSLALIVDDPDAPAGLWTHWAVWNLPAGGGGLPEGVGPGPVPGGGVQGSNSWGNARWQGPCPPGGTHRYRFRLFALDDPLPLASGASVASLDRALRGHVLGEAMLTGRYARRG